jgi:hypothetical protein
LVAPYLIDWTSYRETFEREAGAYLGKPVTVAGKASVRLLPTPTLNFTDVRVGDKDRPDLTIENIRAELELPGLLRGDVRVIQMRVDRPTLRLDIATLAQSRTGMGAEEDDGRLDPESVSLDSMEINSGQVLVFDSRTGQQWTASAVNAQLEARSLTGPGKIEGGLVLNGTALSFRASAGRMAPTGIVPLKVSMFSARLPFVTRLSGKILTREEDGLVYEGGFTTAELADMHEEEEPAANDDSGRAVVDAVGTFRLSADNLSLPEVQISYGLRDRPLQLAGDASVRFGATPYFDVNLDARQIDVDRALGGGPNDPVGISKAFTAFVENLKSLPLAPIDGELHLDAKGVVVGGSVIQAVGADLKPRSDGWHVDILSALLPGQTRIDISGALQISGTPRFKGTGKVESGRPAAFASWWRGEAGNATLVDRFSIESALDLTENQQTASDLVADIDGGIVRGSIDMRQFQETGQQVFVDVALTANALDLEKAQVVADLLAGDAVSGGHVDRMAVSLEADRLHAGGVDAENVVLKGTLEPKGFDLKALSVENLAGASIRARGRIDDPMGKPGGRVNVDVAADDLSGTAQFLKGLFPENNLVTRFDGIAGLLSPAQAQLLLSARQTDNVLALDLSGTFGGTRVNLEMSGRGTLDDLSTLEGQADGLIVADQTAALLRQAGFDILPIDDTGPARIALKAAGKPVSELAINTDGTLAGIGFSFDGNGKFAKGALSMEGGFDARSQSVDNALLMAGIALPGIGNGYPMALSGDAKIDGYGVSVDLADSSFDGMPASGSVTIDLAGPVRIGGDLTVGSLSIPQMTSSLTGQLPLLEQGAWPDTPFARAMPDGLEFDIALSAAELDLGLGPGARNAAMRFALKGGNLNLDSVKADWAGGRIEGELGIGTTDLGQDMSLRVSLAGVSLQDVIWLKDGRAVARGTLDSSFSLNGRGRSLAGMVSTLSGSGSFSIGDGIIRSINPTAFSSIIRAADTGLVLNPDRVRSVFEGYLDAGSLPFERASGSFGVSSGAIRVSTMSLDTKSATALGSGLLDLNTQTLSSDWSLKVDPGNERVTGAEPEVGVLFSGPVGNPRRVVDVTPLMGYLTVRAFEKEVTRIEALQANIQERERLVRLLKVQREQADERVRRKAEEEAAAKRAEEEARLAAEEEARLAAEREAARIAAEKEARLAAEEAARRAAEEEARLAAEREAARIAAEKEAARLAAQEAARLAAQKEAARLAAEREAARLAAEEKARLAAEREAARIAAEKEAARLAAEREAARLAAEEARLAAEREAARIAAQKEAERLAAEREAARLAAEEEARLAAEREAARIAAEEAAEARRQAEEILSSQPGEDAAGDQPFEGLDIESIIRNSEQSIDGAGGSLSTGPDAQSETADQVDPQAADLPPLTTQTIKDSQVFTEEPAASSKPVASARRRQPRRQAPEPEPEPEGPIYKTLPNGVTIKIR